MDAEFRAAGRASWWDAWTGDIHPADEGPRQCFELRAKEAKVLVFAKQSDVAPPTVREGQRPATPLALDGPWEFQVEPTLDNRFHDFSFVAPVSILGPEARRFLSAEEHEDGLTGWSETTYSFGPRMEVAGPFPPGADAMASPPVNSITAPLPEHCTVPAPVLVNERVPFCEINEFESVIVFPASTRSSPWVCSRKLILFAVTDAGAFVVMLSSGPVFAGFTLAP